MTGINGLGAVSAPRTAPPRRTGARGFHVEAEAAGAPVAAMAVSMPSLLGLQEAQQDAASDRDARRHADEVLDTLKDLQRHLLDGGGTDGLDRMAQLVRHAPAAADPQLGAVQKALMVRVAVEQARARAAASV